MEIFADFFHLALKHVLNNIIKRTFTIYHYYAHEQP